MTRDFFADGDITIGTTRLSHLRDFLEFIAHRTTDMREQDKVFNLQDKVTAKRFPRDMFDTADDDQEKEPEFLSDDEIAAACRKADRRGELVIRFLFDTGCRISELRAVTPNDIDFNRDGVGAAVRIAKKKTRKGNIELPKSEAGNRTVELTIDTAAMLQAYIDENDIATDDEIFPHSDKTYQDDVKDAFTAAGIQLNDGPDADAYKVKAGRSFVSCHWLRHNRDTRIKKEHGPVAAQQYMGHRIRT